AALAMAIGVVAVGRSSKLASDTSIGLLLVGMLALGVVIVSRSQSFAVDLTGFLFGDVLAVRYTDIAVLAGALMLSAGAVLIGHRAFVAATFDPHKAATLGMRPQLAGPAITVLMAVAIVASFHVVGTLLVLGLLVAPPAAALVWAHSIPRIMALAATFGTASVYVGLLVSWHAGTAGGATIAGVAVLMFFCVTALAKLRSARKAAIAAVSACLLITACAGGDDVAVEGAREIDDPLTRLVLADPVSGETSVYEALDETETPVGKFGSIESITGDGRFAYLRSGDRLTIVDAGAWTFDHGDHYHYFATEPAVAGTVDIAGAGVNANNSLAVIRSDGGAIELLDRERLGRRETAAPPNFAAVDGPLDVAEAVPFGDRLLIVTRAGAVRVVNAQGQVDELALRCPSVAWGLPTRRAVVFGCDGGALRVTGGDGEPVVTEIPFPPNALRAKPARMDHRDRSDVFAGVGDGTVWVLDGRQRSWTPIPAPDAIAANTAGDGSVLVLTRDGSLRAFDVASGSETASVGLFTGGVPTAGPAPVVEIDADRAYVNDAAARRVYEIDYRNGLRIARTLTTEVRPGLMIESGR
ncbi:MAG TPA: metal ABC transporter permease, partial [Mycobacterium sp.]|nr:metal ABC transporter permease [Mycobacterium sp.]